MSEKWQKRTREVKVRVSDREYGLIHKKMDQAGVVNLSAYLRKMAIDGYVIRFDFSDIREAVRLLRYCSNNLNQYAKKANETGSIYERDIRDLQRRFEHVWEMVNRIMTKLSQIE